MLDDGIDLGTATGTLVDRFEANDETAAEALHARFAEPVCHLADRLLSDRLKQKMDGQDIAQSVFRSLFCHAANGDYEFAHTGALWRLLVRMTRNRVYFWARHFNTGRRDIRREVDADIEFIDGHSAQFASEDDLRLAEELAEAVESIVCRLDERDAEIFFAWYYEQTPTLEIADRFGCGVATVNRVLARIREQIGGQLEWNA